MDTPAFQHLLSLFPLLTLRQRVLLSSSVLTKTPLARLRKPQYWELYAQALIEGLTVQPGSNALRGQQKHRFPLAASFLAHDDNSSSHS